MKIGEITISKIQLAGIVVLLIGLIAGIFLVQQRQIFKPKASTSILSAFDITGPDGKQLNCTSGNPPTCETSSLDVNIKLKPGGLDVLSQP